MRIAVVGASGWLGGAVARAAVGRGHEVTAIGRDPEKLAALEGMAPVRADATDVESIAGAIAGHDVVVLSVTDRSSPDRSMIPRATQAVIDAFARADVPRLAMIGGGGSLLNENGERFVDQDDFPPQYRAEALAAAEALALLRATPEQVDWTYLSPPPENLTPGDSRGGFVVRGDDHPATDDAGHSAITSGDLAAALAQLELGEDAPHVGLDGRLGEDQALGDLGVGQAAGDLEQDLALPGGQQLQAGEFGGSDGRRGSGQAVRKGRQQPARDAGSDHRIAVGDRADGRQQLPGRRVLEQKAAGAGAQPGVDVFVEVEGGEDDDPSVAVGRGDQARRLHPVDLGHAHVHQHDVGGGPLGRGHGLAAGRGFPDDRHVRLALDHHAKAHPHQPLIVGQQDSDRHVSAARCRHSG